MTTVIKAEDLSKRYIISHQKLRYRETLRETMTGMAKGLYQRVRHPLSPNRETLDLEEFWALKDINFQIQQGERVGIIGRNGAGKSTLLKVLSRITEPTTGKVRIKGRVSSLLEVGTGFHPELSGRENVFLNGAILGMTRQEIKRKFDEIVDFSEVEKFLDTPVKRYSSGMYVRLAFAVAAHLEPEILIVDEVLAVGDAQFQKKCLGKMKDVAKEGRTVLFVSHNMVAMQALCPRAIWLNDGQMKKDGNVTQIVSDYLQSSAASQTQRIWDDIKTAPGNDIIRLYRGCVQPENGLPSDPIAMKAPFVIEFEFWNQMPDAYLNLNICLTTEQQVVVFSSDSIEQKWWGRPFPTGLFRCTCNIPGNLLNSGGYSVMVRVAKDGKPIYRHDDVLNFEILDSPERRGSYYGKTLGIIHPRFEWNTVLVKEVTFIRDNLPSTDDGK